MTTPQVATKPLGPDCWASRASGIWEPLGLLLSLFTSTSSLMPSPSVSGLLGFVPVSKAETKTPVLVSTASLSPSPSESRAVKSALATRNPRIVSLSFVGGLLKRLLAFRLVEKPSVQRPPRQSRSSAAELLMPSVAVSIHSWIFPLWAMVP